MTNFIISEESLNLAFNTLGKLPYREVAMIINEIQEGVSPMPDDPREKSRPNPPTLPEDDKI